MLCLVKNQARICAECSWADDVIKVPRNAVSQITPTRIYETGTWVQSVRPMRRLTVHTALKLCTSSRRTASVFISLHLCHPYICAVTSEVSVSSVQYMRRRGNKVKSRRILKNQYLSRAVNDIPPRSWNFSERSLRICRFHFAHMENNSREAALRVTVTKSYAFKCKTYNTINRNVRFSLKSSLQGMESAVLFMA